MLVELVVVMVVMPQSERQFISSYRGDTAPEPVEEPKADAGLPDGLVDEGMKVLTQST